MFVGHMALGTKIKDIVRAGHVTYLGEKKCIQTSGKGPKLGFACCLLCAHFLLGLLFSAEDSSEMWFRNVG
jgi:hypothetical protein